MFKNHESLTLMCNSPEPLMAVSQTQCLPITKTTKTLSFWSLIAFSFSFFETVWIAASHFWLLHFFLDFGKKYLEFYRCKRSKTRTLKFPFRFFGVFPRVKTSWNSQKTSCACCRTVFASKLCGKPRLSYSRSFFSN